MKIPSEVPARFPLFSIALVSSVALGYEILLMRLFSIIQWHHFAYMIISLALLGYGASGTFLAITRRWLVKNFPAAYLILLVLFGLSILVCFLTAQHIPFNPEEVLWDFRQPMRLLVIYLLLALPFFFAATCIGLALTRFTKNISRIYAADLVGAGVGSLGIIVLLYLAFPISVLRILSALGIFAGALAWWELRFRPPALAILIVLVSIFPLGVPDSVVKLEISPYKDLNQTLRVAGRRVIREQSSPLGWITVVESPQVPFRHAPGLSLNAAMEPPEQLALFTDADSMSVITRYKGEVETLDYLDQLTSALPYHMNQPDSVLILGAGGGTSVLQAVYHGVEQIDAVELNPQIVELLRNDYLNFSGGIFKKNGVRIHTNEARGFVVGHNQRYDLIQLTLFDSFGASSAGLYALSENYIYTVEAIQDYLRRLSPRGYLAVSRWVKLPPRDTLKLFATVVESLKASGVTDPDKRMVLVRNWQTSTLIVKNEPFTIPEITTLKRFCEARSFDVAYYPGMPVSQANRFNVLEQPYFYIGANALLGEEAGDYLARYKFNLFPATDNKPYFSNFFKWQVLPEIISLRGQGGTPLLEMGYLLLLATLIQAVAASLVLILLPLGFYKDVKHEASGAKSRGSAFIYFFSIGIAFLFLEMAFIQKFILFLHHPLLAVAVVLAAFLIFAGIGSLFSKHLMNIRKDRASIIGPVGGIMALGIIYIVSLGPLFNLMMPLPDLARILISIGLIAPMAFCMGMPFPLGLARLGEKEAELIPWVWGVNGCASVISAVLATLLAIHFGFIVVVLLALILYGVAASVFP